MSRHHRALGVTQDVIVMGMHIRYMIFMSLRTRPEKVADECNAHNGEIFKNDGRDVAWVSFGVSS